jgi:hypothetical protein
MKKCAKCGEQKPLSNFRKKVDGKFGVGAQCKICINLKQAPNKSYRHLKGYDRYKNNHFLKNYKITLQEVNEIIKNQGFKCAICEKHLTPGKQTHLDHCHDSNKIRGVLCTTCNVGLGMFKDSLLLLKSALNYLEKYNSKDGQKST